MNKLLLFVFLLSTGSAWAQKPMGDLPPGAPPVAPDGKGTTATGRIYGKVLDTAGHGIADATVLVLQTGRDTAGKPKETLLQGAGSENNGDFSMEGIPMQLPLTLKISAIGYETITRTLSPGGKTVNRDLGNLRMRPGANVLKGVTVTATKPYMTVDMEKRVFDVSRTIVAAGGTGTDVLKNVPGVQVDIDGNISIRGGSPQLLVDGKPSMLTLEQIPSDAIESVEVINNPSARYDASGGGTGILNIILKKNRQSGYNGNVRAGIDNYGGVNGGASLNIRQQKFNFSADINARSPKDRTIQSIERANTGLSPATYLQQQQRDSSTGSMIFAKLGLDYFVSNRTTLSLTGFMMHHGMDVTSYIDINTDYLYPTGSTRQFSHQDISNNRSFNGRGATLGVKHLFAREKESWTADASYFSGNGDNTADYVTNTYAATAGSALTASDIRRIKGSGKDQNIVLQTDYTLPFSAAATLETGLRAAMQSRRNINDNYTYNPDLEAYQLVPAAASNYKSQNNVYAAYATLSGTLQQFSYKAGLRAESSDYSGTLLNSGEHFSNQYPLSLFPTVFLGRKLGHGQDLQLSYTRRVNRPNFFQLIPFTDSSNKLNITRGNPDLRPEFTQSLEAAYLKTLPRGGLLMASAYYKYTSHLITGYIGQQTDPVSGNTTIINTYVNAASGFSTGLELTGQYTPRKWWDINGSVNLYHSEISLGNSDISYQQIPWSWFGKVNSNFRLPAGFSLQLSGMYQSKSNLPVNTGSNQPGPPNMQAQSAAQGYILPYYEIGIAAKKALLNNKIVLSLGFNDIFRSRVQDQYTYNDYLSQYYKRLRNPQMLRLSVSWNFGKLDAGIFQRKNNNVQSEEQ